jgi:hypothetical protein
MTALTWDIQLYIGSWTSVKEDTVLVVPVEWSGGATSSDPVGVRIAGTGVLSFALDNSSSNSGGLQGYYSPGHTNCRAGFARGTKVRVSLTSGGTTRYWKFKIVDAIPMPGIYRERYTSVTAVDYINELASRRVERIPVQTNVTSDTLYQALIDNLPAAPDNTDFGVGVDTFLYAFHDIQDERSTAYSVAQKVALSGLEYFYLTGDATDGETLVSESRHARLVRTTDEATFSNTMVDMAYRQSIIYNIVRATVHPAYLDTSPETILATLQREIQIGAGATLDPIIFRYRDPDGASSRIAGLDMQTPVAGTDYNMSTYSGGTGNDLNANLSLTVDFGGNSASVTPENTGGTRGFINTLNLRGRGLYLYDPIDVVAEDSTSITANGPNELSLNLAYCSNPSVGQDFVDWLLSIWKDPQAPDEIESITFVANRNSTFMGYGCSLDVGSRVVISETVGGASNDFFANRVSRRIEPGNILKVTLSSLELAQSVGDWLILDTGRLDQNKLGV